MDKFVVHIPASRREAKPKPAEKQKVQTRIEDMRKVVKLDRVHEIRAFIESAADSSDAGVVASLRASLRKLETEYFVSLECLEETKLGIIVSKLKKHSDDEVKASAARLISAWKKTAEDALHRRLRQEQAAAAAAAAAAPPEASSSSSSGRSLKRKREEPSESSAAQYSSRAAEDSSGEEGNDHDKGKERGGSGRASGSGSKAPAGRSSSSANTSPNIPEFLHEAPRLQVEIEEWDRLIGESQVRKRLRLSTGSEGGEGIASSAGAAAVANAGTSPSSATIQQTSAPPLRMPPLAPKPSSTAVPLLSNPVHILPMPNASSVKHLKLGPASAASAAADATSPASAAASTAAAPLRMVPTSSRPSTNNTSPSEHSGNPALPNRSLRLEQVSGPQGGRSSSSGGSGSASSSVGGGNGGRLMVEKVR